MRSHSSFCYFEGAFDHKFNMVRVCVADIYSSKKVTHNILVYGQKGDDLTQSCDKNPYTHRKIQKAT